MKSSLISSGFRRPESAHSPIRSCAHKKMSRTFPTLSGSLEFFGDLLLGFYLDGNPHLLFKFLTKLNPRAEAPVIAYPDEEFAVGP